MGFTANNEIYDWIKNESENLHISMSAMITVKLSQKKNEEDALKALQKVNQNIEN